ncbi:MAG: DUF4013 domain-containing protein [Actinomycetota bacterium]|jgi:hypothetical protein|nr:DUF4013 domain-containing protein [Actinomycetota bacterium]
MTTNPPPLPTAGGSPPLLDFARAFQFFFEDPEWVKKLAIGSILCLLSPLIIGAILLGGYILRVVRRTADGAERVLPDFDDWGGLFRDGLKLFVVYFGHLIAIFSVPVLIVLVAFLMTGGLGGRNEGLAALIGVSFAFAYMLFILLAFAFSLYMPAVLARLAKIDDIGAAFDVRENVAFILRNPWNYGLTIVLYFITSFVSQLGMLLCCVGILPASFWAATVAAWAIGSTIRLDVKAPRRLPVLI